MLKEEILPALERLRREKGQFLEWQAANANIDRLRRFCVAYRIVETERCAARAVATPLRARPGTHSHQNQCAEGVGAVSQATPRTAGRQHPNGLHHTSHSERPASVARRQADCQAEVGVKTYKRLRYASHSHKSYPCCAGARRTARRR